MEIQAVSFEGKCPRRMAMTPTKQKSHVKNIVINSVKENKCFFSKYFTNVHLFRSNQYVNNFYKLV